MIKKIVPSFYGICLFFMVFLSSIKIGAESPPPGWSIGPSLTTYWGQASEIVYYSKKNQERTENPYLSYLAWDILPAIFLGVESRWESGRYGALDMGIHLAIPGIPSGEMNDFDWLNLQLKDWTHWSLSDVTLEWGLIIDAVYDWRIVDVGPFSLLLGLGYHMDLWSWKDKVKNSLYSSKNGFRDKPNAVPMGINAINYMAAYISPLAKIGVNLQFRSFFSRFHFRIGPVIALDYDHHLLRTANENSDGLKFFSQGFGGPWMDIVLDIGFRTQGLFSFYIRGEYAWFGETRGNSNIVYSNGSGNSYVEDSTGFEFWRASISVRASWFLGK